MLTSVPQSQQNIGYLLRRGANVCLLSSILYQMSSKLLHIICFVHSRNHTNTNTVLLGNINESSLRGTTLDKPTFILASCYLYLLACISFHLSMRNERSTPASASSSSSYAQRPYLYLYPSWVIIVIPRLCCPSNINTRDKPLLTRTSSNLYLHCSDQGETADWSAWRSCSLGKLRANCWWNDV